MASPDKKTVLKMLVMDPGEAGFVPSAVARSAAVQELPEELKQGIEACKVLIQLNFESHNPDVYSACHLMQSLLQRLAMLTDGIVGDPGSSRYGSGADFAPAPGLSKLLATQFVSTPSRVLPTGYHVYTQGLWKFGLPEIEVEGVSEELAPLGQAFLLSAAQAVLDGTLLQEGAQVGSQRVPFDVRVGGLDRKIFGEHEAFELVPPITSTADEGLRAWSEEFGNGKV